jgi:DNA-binding Xre family transcriptional regulator
MPATLAPMTAKFRLREILEDAGISQSDFAKLADLSFATVNRLCTNATEQVHLQTLDKIMAALERASVRVTLDDLIERDAPKRRGRG